MGTFDTFMKVFFCFMLAAMLGFLPVTACRADIKDRFVAIAYHDVVRTRAELASDAVTIDHLVSQFEWLLAHHYHPVSIDDLLAAREGKKNLPDRAVLLCWDDGYASFYNLVFPLLKAYNFPAVLALEGSWIEPGQATKVRYGQNTIPRSHFLSWRQLRELAASPLIEIASHSFDLHHGVLADRFGDKLPPAIAHRYDPRTRRYETDQERFERIYRDLEKNSRLLQKRLGKRPRVMVWPFGRYNQAALAAASRAGMDITLTLDPVPGNIDNLRKIGRMYPTLNPDLAEFRTDINPDIMPPARHFSRLKPLTCWMIRQRRNIISAFF
jgi:biofilm PGA synthesis lipoprotein PgaB